MQDIEEIDAVLLEERQVEPQVVTHFCDALRGRKLAGQQICRIAGQQSDQEEDDERDHQELGQQEKQALPGVAHKSHRAGRNGSRTQHWPLVCDDRTPPIR